jgi:hypothetical protein
VSRQVYNTPPGYLTTAWNTYDEQHAVAGSRHYGRSLMQTRTESCSELTIKKRQTPRRTYVNGSSEWVKKDEWQILARDYRNEKNGSTLRNFALTLFSLLFQVCMGVSCCNVFAQSLEVTMDEMPHSLWSSQQLGYSMQQHSTIACET